MTHRVFDFDGALSPSDRSILLGRGWRRSGQGRGYDVAGEMQGLVEQGLRGELDFETSLRQHVSLLEGMSERQVQTAFER